MKKTMRLAAFFFVLTLLSALGWATSVRTLNLFEMVELSDRVFEGRCLSAETKVEESTRLPIVEYTFEVRQAIKGVQAGQKIVFRQVGSMRGGIAGIPHYRKGQELLLFLHADSKLGLTSPVGLAQGTFRLEKTSDKGVGVINPFRNRNLGRNLAFAQVQESGLSAPEWEQIQKEEAIPLPVFRSLVERIGRYQARKAGSLQ